MQIADHTNPQIDAFFTPSLTRSFLPAPMFCPVYGAMVCPNDSNGQVIRLLIFCAAVTPATAVAPSTLTAAVITREPIAVMEYCNPIGTPMAQSRFM